MNKIITKTETEKYINKISKIKTLSELNNLEIELTNSYWFLYTKNNFIKEIEGKRNILYSYC